MQENGQKFFLIQSKKLLTSFDCGGIIRSRSEANEGEVITMMRQEFIDRFGVEVPAVVYERVEKLYMESDLDKDNFVKKVKRESTVIKIQNEVINEMQMKIQELARRAVQALDRRESAECNQDGNVTNWEIWGMLNTQVDLACDILNIDRYLPYKELRNKLFLATI
jgi:hypothetical protein